MDVKVTTKEIIEVMLNKALTKREILNLIEMKYPGRPCAYDYLSRTVNRLVNHDKCKIKLGTRNGVSTFKLVYAAPEFLRLSEERINKSKPNVRKSKRDSVQMATSPISELNRLLRSARNGL